MNSTQKKVFELIEEQQKGKENTAPWMVGEQLKEIAEREPQSAELLFNDLQVESMSIVEAEKQIKAYSDKHKKGNCFCVTPIVAEGILREFYGLPKRDEKPAEETVADSGYIDLDAFL